MCITVTEHVDPTLLSLEEAAVRLSCSVQTVRRHIEHDRLKRLDVMGRVMVRVVDVAKLLKGRPR